MVILTKKIAENSAKNTLEGKYFDPDGNWHSGVALLGDDGVHLIPALIAPPTDMEQLGDIAVGISAVELVTVASVTRHFRLEYDIDGTGVIFIGKSDVLNDGTNHFARLYPGRVEHIDWNNATEGLYIISSVAGQTVGVGVLL